VKIYPLSPKTVQSLEVSTYLCQ